MKKIYSIAAMALLLGLSACSDDSSEPLDPNDDRGYANVKELRSALEGEWTVDLDGVENEDYALIWYKFFHSGDADQINYIADFDTPEISYHIDTLGIEWAVKEQKDKGGKKDVVVQIWHKESTGYNELHVEKLVGDTLFCTFYSEFEETSSYLDVKLVKRKKKFDPKELIVPTVRNNNPLEWGTSGGKWEYATWMKNLPDNTKINRMTVPGSHDATTYNIEQMLKFGGATQVLNIGEQWEKGCRAFDFRVRYEDGAVKLYHNFIPCNMTLENALKQLKAKMDQYPSETAFLIIKPEGNDAAIKLGSVVDDVLEFLLHDMFSLDLSFKPIDETKAHENTVKLLKQYFPWSENVSSSKCAYITPTTTLGECRGKLIPVMRFSYKEIPGQNEHLGYVSSWDGKGTMQTHFSNRDNPKINIYVQDEYGQDEEEDEDVWEARKANAFCKAWDMSATDDTDCWFFNAPTGAYTETFNLPNYPKMAQYTYLYFRDVIVERPGCGVMLSDFIGRGGVQRIGWKSTAAIVLACKVLYFDYLVKKAENSLYSAAAKLSDNNYNVHCTDLFVDAINNNYEER